MKATASAKVQGMDIPITMISAAPNKTRIDIQFQGKEITQMAFDGETGWTTNFMTMEAEAMEQTQSDILKTQNEFPDAFLNYQDKGYSVSLEGEEEIEGVPCYKVKLTKNPVTIDGKEEEVSTMYYFDKESFVPIMQRDFTLYGPQKGMAVETYMSDYDEVDGLYFAFTVVQRVNGQDVFNVVMDNIELNVDVPDTMFAMPEKMEEGDKGEE